MITSVELIQLKAFARQDGFFIGLLGVCAFACFVGSMRMPLLQMLFVVLSFAAPVVAYLRLKHYRDAVLSGTVSWRRAFFFVAYMLACASLIVAAAVFVYFYFFDHGAFFTTLQHNMSLPEVRQQFADAGMNPAELEQQLALATQARPADLAISVITNGIISSVVLATIISFLGRRARPVTTKH